MLPDSNSPLLDVKELSVRIAETPVVKNISFRIGQKETLGLVGESGSGKSITSLALMRLLPPQAVVRGSIRFVENAGTSEPDLDLLELSDAKMRRLRGRRIAMIFQEPMTALNPAMRIGEQIAEALRAHHPHITRHELRDRTLAALEEVSLPDASRRMRDYPHQFSGGQRQRIVIAIALANRPSLLIADEPTTALDVTVQAQILDLLRSLQQTHALAMLFISHDLAAVRQVAHRIVVMQAGQIIDQAAANDLLLYSKNPYTQRLLASIPSMTTDRDRPLATVVSG